MFRPPVFLAEGVPPYLVPSGLIPGVPLLQFGLDGGHELAPEFSLAVIISGEKVEGILAGHPTDGSSTPKKKAVLLLQDGPPRDIDRATKALELGPLPGYILPQ